MNSIKYAHELLKENSRAERGGLEGTDPGWSTADALRYRCATLIKKKSITVQAPGSGHAGPGELESYPTSSNMSAKWRA